MDLVAGAPEPESAGLPKLEGRRARAHDVSIDLGLEIGSEDLRARAAEPPRRPRPVGSTRPNPAASSSSSAATSAAGGQRLSLSDYKKRLSQAGF